MGDELSREVEKSSSRVPPSAGPARITQQISPTRRRRNLIIAVVILAPLLILAAWGLAFAGSAGMLPWQPEPTRIAITPFADLPGLSGAATPSP